MDILDALKTATPAISPKYFLLPVAGCERPVKRERVYCYELYHQLRCTLGDSELMLTGEPDKRGHPQLPPINPDFILHVPGGSRVNTAAVEVECRIGYRHLLKDLRNLKTMQQYGYDTLVLLLFANQTVPWPALRRASESAYMDLRKIVVLLHREAGIAATHEAQY